MCIRDSSVIGDRDLVVDTGLASDMSVEVQDSNASLRASASRTNNCGVAKHRVRNWRIRYQVRTEEIIEKASAGWRRRAGDDVDDQVLHRLAGRQLVLNASPEKAGTASACARIGTDRRITDADVRSGAGARAATYAGITGECHDLSAVGVCLDYELKLARYVGANTCLLYTSPSPRDATLSRMPSSA